MRRLLAVLVTVSGVGVAAAAAAVSLWAPHRAPDPDLGPGVYVQVATPAGTPSTATTSDPAHSRTTGPEHPGPTRSTHQADPTLSASGAQTVPRHSPAQAGPQRTGDDADDADDHDDDDGDDDDGDDGEDD